MDKSGAGRKGAASFWKRFREDPVFRRSIVAKWKVSKHDHDDLVRAARAGGYALWRKYRSDADFRSYLDSKLSTGRSRGGSHSLRNLGEDGFKKRLEGAHRRLPSRKYISNLGVRVRSPEELRVANAFEEASILYDYEPRFVVGDHAFYPDFRLVKQDRIIEVAGYAGDRYWRGLIKKIKLLMSQNPDLEVFIITSFGSIIGRYLAGDSKITIFKWSDLKKMVSLCRE